MYLVPTFTKVGFSILSLVFLLMAVIGFSGKGANLLIGKEGTIRRNQYKEKEYLRFHGWLGAVLFAICVFAVLGIQSPWASTLLIFGAMMLPYIIIISGYMYMRNNRRFLKNSELNNMNLADRKMRSHGISFLVLLYALPVLLFFAAIIERYYYAYYV